MSKMKTWDKRESRIESLKLEGRKARIKMFSLTKPHGHAIHTTKGLLTILWGKGPSTNSGKDKKI